VLHGLYHSHWLGHRSIQHTTRYTQLSGLLEVGASDLASRGPSTYGREKIGKIGWLPPSHAICQISSTATAEGRSAGRPVPAPHPRARTRHSRARTRRRNVLRIERAKTADSADCGHALVEGGEAAIGRAVLAHAVIGAPWIVLGIGVRADPRDAVEKRGYEEESLQAPTPFGLPGIETPDLAALLRPRCSLLPVVGREVTLYRPVS
jgi:hypothetical protein